MHKVKSAPANLCLMKNNKKNIKNISDKKNNIICFNKNINIEDTKSKNIKLENIENIKTIKNKKYLLSNINDLTNNIIQDSKIIDSDEFNIITLIINYIFENIYKKKKLEEFKNYIVSYAIRYFIMFMFHSYIIHDADYKYIHTLEIIHKINF